MPRGRPTAKQRVKNAGAPVRFGGVGSFLILLVVLRVIFLLGALDPAQERTAAVLEPAEVDWPGGPERPLYDTEELYTGTAAQAIREGTDLPLVVYRFMPYGNGSLLISLLAVPLYALFGPHYLTFKILPLLVTILGGFFWFRAVALWAGPRVARWFGLLYILAPPMLVRTALIAKGDHAEAMAIIGAVLFLASRAALSPRKVPRGGWAAATGLLAGLGVWVTYSTLPVLFGVGVAALVRTRLRPLRAWIAFAAGLAIGLLPWLFNVLGAPTALQVYGRSLGSTVSLAEAGARLARLLNSGLLAGYDLPAVAASAVALLWLAAVVVGWTDLLRGGRRTLALCTLIGTLLLLAAFCLRAPDASSRYLVPGYPLFLTAVAWLAVPRSTTGERVPRRQRWRTTWVGLLLLAGLVSQLWAIGTGGFIALRAPLRGTNWPLLGYVTGEKLSPQAIRELPDPLRAHFWVGFGRRVFVTVPRDQWQSAADLAGPTEAKRVWYGIGTAWMETGLIRDAAGFLPGLPDEHRAALRRGLTEYGQILFAPLIRIARPQVLLGLLESFAPEDRGELRASLGQNLATQATQGILPSHWSAMQVRQVLGTDAGWRAAGWALFRDTQGGRRIRRWNPPADSWVAARAAEAARGAAPQAFWEGMAAAYELELMTRSPSFLVGTTAGPEGLAAELARVVGDLPPQAAAPFYRAAGRAAGRVLGDPEGAGVTAAQWDWRQAIPATHVEAFAAGLADLPSSL